MEEPHDEQRRLLYTVPHFEAATGLGQSNIWGRSARGAKALRRSSGAQIRRSHVNPGRAWLVDTRQKAAPSAPFAQGN
jgi:hypothetical protein